MNSEFDRRLQAAFDYWRSARYQEAATEFESALALDPQHAQCLMWLGYTHVMLDQHDAADMAFSKVIALTPGSELATAAREQRQFLSELR